MIEFQNVTRVYGSKKAVDNVNIKIKRGEFVCFIGTSGSGKTTCMRMINRMETPSSGKIFIDGKDINEMNEVNLRRGIGYVIQQIGLLPHLTIYENIVMVPRLLKWSEEQMQKTARELMERVDLPLELLDAYPSALSGGMQQRVGVIRALAANQDIILMDEPFGALDPITRESLQRLIKDLQAEMEKTIIFVTHDMDEAINLADKIVILDKGKVVQQGTPKEIITEPVNDFVRNLVGEKRLTQAIFEYKSVTEVMREPIKILETKTVADAAKLMGQSRIDDLLVVDETNTLVGRLNIYTMTQRDQGKTRIKDIMKRAIYIKDTTNIRDAIYFIHDLGYRNLAVVDNQKKLVGLITRGDLVSTMYTAFWQDYTPEITAEITLPADLVLPEATTTSSQTDQPPATAEITIEKTTVGGDSNKKTVGDDNA